VTNVTISVPGNQDESNKNNKIGSRRILDSKIRPIENNAVKIVIKPLKPYQKYMMKSEGSIFAHFALGFIRYAFLGPIL
jgi:hypothetical protein